MGFSLSEYDKLTYENASFGNIACIYFHERKDFERFIQIIRYRCEPIEIPQSVGAMYIKGIINWRKIEEHCENYRDSIIVLSRGLYSNTPMDQYGLPANKLEEISYFIRRYHEFTHFICRHCFGKIEGNLLWEKIVADGVGIISSIGTYIPELASEFLGIINVDGKLEYKSGSRLEVYMNGRSISTSDLNMVKKYIDMVSEFFKNYPWKEKELEVLIKAPF